MNVHIMKDGKTVSSLKNLSGIMAYARKESVATIIMTNRDGEGELTIHFGDGAVVDTMFESFTVMKQWVDNKVSRSPFWRLATVMVRE